MASCNKKDFRHKSLAKLKKIAHRVSAYSIDSRINRALTETLNVLNPKSILFFYPLGIEADIRPTIGYFRKKQPKKRLYLPFMQDVSFKMVALRLPLFKKKFGVKEPLFSYFNHHRVDVAVIPIVGTDKNLRRIGYGRGMYDRFFSCLQNRPTTIFITRSLCLSHEIITQRYDVQADLIITADIALLRDKTDDRVDRIKLASLRTALRRSDFLNRKKSPSRQLQNSY